MLSRLIVVFLVGIFFSGCSSSNEPGEADIKKALLEHTEKGMSISDIEIKANENTGSEVEPRFKTRFVVKFEMTEPLFERVQRIRYNHRSVDVVRKVVSKGDEFEFFGLAGSTLHNEAWQTRIVSMDSDTPPEGRLLSSFDHSVMEDSAEHEAALAERDAWNKAEDVRRVREKKDLEIARMKREEQAAKAKAKAKAEKEAKRAAEQAARMSAIKKELAKLQGTWQGTYSDGSPVKFIFSKQGNSIEYIGECKPGQLYLDKSKSKPSRLIFSEVSPRPCTKSTDAIILLDKNRFRLEYVGSRSKPFIAYRK